MTSDRKDENTTILTNLQEVLCFLFRDDRLEAKKRTKRWVDFVKLK